MICGQTPFHDYNMDGIMRNIIRGKVRFGHMLSEPVKEVIQVTKGGKIVVLLSIPPIQCLTIIFLCACC
jgi:hypothetical protein